MKRPIFFGEFFSGPGGMSQGAVDALKGLPELADRIEMVPTWAVDFEKDSCRTYHRNIHGGEGVLASMEDEWPVPGIHVAQGPRPLVLHADVRKVRTEKLNAVDAFLFGFPCNDFSTAGEQKGLDGKYGQLYKEGLRLIRDKKPLFFVAENVSGLLHANDYGALVQIMDELRLSDLFVGKDQDGNESFGYEVTPHLYKFEEYGVPQTRHRILLVGIRKDVDVALSPREDGRRGFVPPKPSGQIMSAETALIGLTLETKLPNNEPRGMSDIVERRLKVIPEGKNIWDVNDTIDEELRLSKTGATISSIYKVLDRSRPAYTVVGSGGGGTHMYHWDRRPTTNRERARLQTFDDDFVFEGGISAVRKQIGMAVPPKGASVIIAAVIMTLEGVFYEGVDPNLEKELDPVLVEKKRQKSIRKREVEARKRQMDEAQSIEAGTLAVEADEDDAVPGEASVVTGPDEDSVAIVASIKLSQGISLEGQE